MLAVVLRSTVTTGSPGHPAPDLHQVGGAGQGWSAAPPCHNVGRRNRRDHGRLHAYIRAGTGWGAAQSFIAPVGRAAQTVRGPGSSTTAHSRGFSSHDTSAWGKVQVHGRPHRPSPCLTTALKRTRMGITTTTSPSCIKSPAAKRMSWCSLPRTIVHVCPEMTDSRCWRRSSRTYASLFHRASRRVARYGRVQDRLGAPYTPPTWKPRVCGVHARPIDLWRSGGKSPSTSWSSQNPVMQIFRFGPRIANLVKYIQRANNNSV